MPVGRLGGRTCGAVDRPAVNVLSQTDLLSLSSVRVLSVDADVGWHGAAGKLSINNVGANERATDKPSRRADAGQPAAPAAAKALWRQLGAPTAAVVLINNVV